MFIVLAFSSFVPVFYCDDSLSEIYRDWSDMEMVCSDDWVACVKFPPGSFRKRPTITVVEDHSEFSNNTIACYKVEGNLSGSQYDMESTIYADSFLSTLESGGGSDSPFTYNLSFAIHTSSDTNRLDSDNPFRFISIIRLGFL